MLVVVACGGRSRPGAVTSSNDCRPIEGRSPADAPRLGDLHSTDQEKPWVAILVSRGSDGGVFADISARGGCQAEQQLSNGAPEMHTTRIESAFRRMKLVGAVLAVSLPLLAVDCNLCACSPPWPNITSVRVTPRADTLALGDSAQFRATAYESGRLIREELVANQIVWSVSDSSIVTVTELRGTQTTVRALGRGSARLVVRAGSASDSALLTVP
jgi:hypothetical protein